MDPRYKASQIHQKMIHVRTVEELQVDRKGKSTDSRIIFSAGQGTGSSCSINHPTELISQQWLEKQFCKSKFYRHQQQKKSGCSSFNSKTSRRRMVHSYITEVKHLKTWIPEHPFCQLRTTSTAHMQAHIPKDSVWWETLRSQKTRLWSITKTFL